MHKNRAGNFVGQKRTKRAKRTRFQAKTAEVGCVSGAGEGCSGWRRMKPGEKTQDRLEKGGNSSIAWRKWRDGLELASQALLRCPALSAAAGPPCQSPTAAPSPPRCIRHRRRFGGDARHAPRAEASPPVTTKKERQAGACLSFLAGAEGLEPSARGFGVDVGTNHQERERAGVSRFLPQARKRAVLVWCCELFLGSDCASDYHFFLRKKSTSARRMAKLTRITAG